MRASSSLLIAIASGYSEIANLVSIILPPIKYVVSDGSQFYNKSIPQYTNIIKSQFVVEFYNIN